jgi:hypothetical protein
VVQASKIPKNSQIYALKHNLFLGEIYVLTRVVCAQTARNTFGNTALEVASPKCWQFMKEFQAGGEVAYVRLMEDLEREAVQEFGSRESPS